MLKYKFKKKDIIKRHLAGQNISRTLPIRFDALSFEQSHYGERSPAVGGFYGTGIEIWAGFGLVGITEKKIGMIMSNF